MLAYLFLLDWEFVMMGKSHWILSVFQYRTLLFKLISTRCRGKVISVIDGTEFVYETLSEGHVLVPPMWEDWFLCWNYTAISVLISVQCAKSNQVNYGYPPSGYHHWCVESPMKCLLRTLHGLVIDPGLLRKCQIKNFSWPFWYITKFIILKSTGASMMVRNLVNWFT